jgi:uncharacterized protein YndB with AHSA1/START domain
MSATRSLRFAIYLRATPQQVRAVLSDPALVPRWLAGTQFHTDAEEDPQRLSSEWLQTDHLGANGGSASVVRFEFVAMGQVTRLTVTHRNLVPGGSFLKVIAPGWPMILSSLKSLIETGEPLEFSGCGRPRQTPHRRSKTDRCTRPEYLRRPDSPRSWPRPRC